jgi:hypothetical protein
MGAHICRRHLLISLAAVAVVAPVQAGAQLARYLRNTKSIEPQDLKVVPLPRLPPLPAPEYPWCRYLLFTGGHIDEGGGFCAGACLWSNLSTPGFAREIPHGLDIQTDAQKLRLLGRRKFAPKLIKEIMSAHRNDLWQRADGAAAQMDGTTRTMRDQEVIRWA